jgi:hypothetical protein
VQEAVSPCRPSSRLRQRFGYLTTLIVSKLAVETQG